MFVTVFLEPCHWQVHGRQDGGPCEEPMLSESFGEADETQRYKRQGRLTDPSALGGSQLVADTGVSQRLWGNAVTVELRLQPCECAK